MAFFSGAGQGSARKLNLADAAGQPVHQRRVELLALGDALHVVGELEHGVERDDALRFQDADDLLRHLLAGLGIAGSRSAGQQVHQPLVGIGGAGRCRPEAAPASSSFTPLRPASNSSRSLRIWQERAGDAGEHRVGLAFRNGLLPDQDLPQADQRLEGACHVREEQRVLEAIDALNRIQVLVDGFVADGCAIR